MIGIDSPIVLVIMDTQHNVSLSVCLPLSLSPSLCLSACLCLCLATVYVLCTDKWSALIRRLSLLSWTRSSTWVCLSRCTRAFWFSFSLGFLCVLLPRASLFYFCVFAEFSAVWFELSVQVIALKGSCPKWSIVCQAGHKTLLIRYSLYLCLCAGCMTK